MKFNRNDEMALYMTLADIFDDKNIMVSCIPNKYLAFAVRKNKKSEWQFYEIIGKGGKIIEFPISYTGYKIEIHSKDL